MNQAFDLGGPGPGCSAIQVRRLVAGELPELERDRLRAHIAGCQRCQTIEREIAAEAEALHAALPFDAFAAGVAERLVAPRERGPGQLRRLVTPVLALAASVMVAVAVPRLMNLSGPTAERTRVKGGAGASLFIQDAHGVHELEPGAAVPSAARLRVSLRTAGHAFVAVALREPGEVSLIYAGPAREGPLPDAFEWTSGRTADLVVAFDDRPVNGVALTQQLRAGETSVGLAKSHPGSEWVVRSLSREEP
jgi:anti-sigma factor RsiW